VYLSLICAILFHCFDNLNGDTDKAKTHLRSALCILSERQDQSCNISDGYLDNLGDMLARFDIQSSSYVDTPDFNVLIKPLEDFPGSFTNLIEAARFLIPTLNWVLHLDRSNDYFLPFRANDQIDQGMRATAFSISSILASRLRQWCTIYDALLLRSLATMSSKELRASTLLKIYHMSVTILLTVCHNSNETAYDLCMKEFEKILKLSESLLAAHRADTSIDYNTFSYEMGVISALSFTARKCRHPVTRRKALDLLKQAPPREGPWDCKKTP
jgi:cholestenol delta-isomerase